MTRKRLVKLLMAAGYGRNEAKATAARVKQTKQLVHRAKTSAGSNGWGVVLPSSSVIAFGDATFPTWGRV